MGRNIPDAKRSIQQAFTAPPTGQQGDFGRDALRGFGAGKLMSRSSGTLNSPKKSGSFPVRVLQPLQPPELWPPPTA
jgi:hypothetical protein